MWQELQKLVGGNTLRSKVATALGAFLVALAGQVAALGGANLTAKLVLAALLAAAETALRQVFPTLPIPGPTEPSAPASPLVKSPQSPPGGAAPLG